MDPKQRNRLFNGPSDRKQFYIGSFLTKLSQSDQQNKYFTKSELVEIHSFLRKEVPTNPSLFRLIQTIVDDGVFLDQTTLDAVKSGSVVEYNENQLIELRQTLEEQLKIKRLAQFNKNRIEQRQEKQSKNQLSQKNSNIDILIYCQNVSSQIQEAYEKSIGSEEDNRIAEESINKTLSRLQKVVDNFKQSINKMTESSTKELKCAIDRILIEFLAKKSQENELDEKKTDLYETIETYPLIKIIKQKYLIMSESLSKLNELLKRFAENMDKFQKHKQFRKELNAIKTEIEKQIHRFISDNNSRGIALDNGHHPNHPYYQYDHQVNISNTYRQLMSFIENNQSKVNYDGIINSIQQGKAKIVLLQHQLDCYNNV